jgi:disulfide bond formation protein DsbB
VSRDAVILFLSLLAVGAQLAVVVVMIATLGGRRTAPLRHAILDTVGPLATVLGFIVAAVAMAGSLYFSEVAHFPPCNLCWYQRAAMYPQVAILGLAALRRRDDVWPYALVLCVIGAMISTYHVFLERFPSLESGACDPDNPCTLIWTRRFGYLTIPTKALSAFVLVATLIGIGYAAERRGRDVDAEAETEP